MNKKRLIQSGVLLMCLAVIAVGGFFGRTAWDSLYSPPVINLTSSNYKQVLKKSKVPVYVEFCGHNYADCGRQDQTVDAAAGGAYKGKILFARVNVDTQPALVQDLLGVNESAIDQFPLQIVVSAGGSGLLAIGDGYKSDAQVNAMLQDSLDEVAVNDQHLIHVISTTDLATIVQNGTSEPTLVEICALSDGSCLAEAGAVAHNALANKGKLTVDVYIAESAQSASDQQLQGAIAQALGLQSLPDFLFTYGKYGNLTGAADSTQLGNFIAAGLASNGK